MQRYLALAACLFVSLPALAQTVEQDGPQDKYSLKTERAQHTFLTYHMAMRAAESCRNASFSADDRAAMEKATASQMSADSPDVAIGAARLLTLVRKADDDMDRIISRDGCDGQKTKDSLQFFDAHLASAPGVSAPPPAEGQTAAATPAPVEVPPESLAPAGQ